MLSLYALLFFVLGSSVVAHPVINPIAEIRMSLKDQDCAGPTTWFWTGSTLEVNDKDNEEHVNHVIEFGPNELPRMGTLLEGGEFKIMKENHISDLSSIKGNWGLMPNNTNVAKRLYELVIEPGADKPIEVYKPRPIMRTHWVVVPQYDYNVSRSDHIIPPRVVGRWYRVPIPATDTQDDIPEDHLNDVIEFRNGQVIWYKLGPGGKIIKINVDPEQVRGRLPGTWGRLPEPLQGHNNVYYRIDMLKIVQSGGQNQNHMVRLWVHGVSAPGEEE